MTKVKEPTKTGEVSIGKNDIEINLGENKYTIHKLRAGKFYELLQVYMEMIKDIAPKTSVSDKGEVPVNFDTMIVSMFKVWPTKMVEFIAICCSTIEGEEPLTKEKILKEAYPEQITDTFSACLKLNNVAQNLKNFVAPIGEMGAQVKETK